MPELVSRQEARALGLKSYFTGKPCTHGHAVERHVHNAGCVECLRLRNSAGCWRAQSKRDATVDYAHLTEPQIEAWYAQVRNLRRRYKHRPLEERTILYVPPPLVRVTV